MDSFNFLFQKKQKGKMVSLKKEMLHRMRQYHLAMS